MEIAMNSMCIMFSKAFDIIESEIAGASKYHSLRVASLCAKLGKQAGYDDDSLLALFVCALFHDNALTEHTLNQRAALYNKIDLAVHCKDGQRNIEWLPFAKNVDGYILHHHSCENGSGPFGVHNFPDEAAFIGAADTVDVMFHLQRVPLSKLEKTKDKIAARKGAFSTKSAVEALLEILDSEMLESLHDENIYTTVQQLFPAWKERIDSKTVLRLGRFISHIIDCKSRYTRKHSEQIANRTWLMADYYGFTREEKAQLYLAAAMHDIGKIAIPSEVLEKPGKLEKDEYKTIMSHVRHTYDWLGEIEGLGKVRAWASEHHEKLNGTGYPLGKKGTELDFNSRLMACIDIYQAVSEQRPYHLARSHKETMAILYDMKKNGLIDEKIVDDLNEVMAEYSLKDIPPPVL